MQKNPGAGSIFLFCPRLRNHLGGAGAGEDMFDCRSLSREVLRQLLTKKSKYITTQSYRIALHKRAQVHRLVLVSALFA
eukprot:3129972-Amphidinium_carterae.1